MLDLPHVLLVNDDGIHAPGIKTLYNGLRDIARLSVVAPEAEQSARSQAITLFSPLSFYSYEEKNDIEGTAVKGTPVDCVKVALKVILKNDLPDLIISGINEGSNTGVNVLYSGTVGAAIEGAMHGITSIAISVAGKTNIDFQPALSVAKKCVHAFVRGTLEDSKLLNINIPNVQKKDIKGWKTTYQAISLWNDDFVKQISPQQKAYYWMSGKKFSLDKSTDSDEGAVLENYISITPLQYNMTDTQSLKLMKNKAIFDSELIEN